MAEEKSKYSGLGQYKAPFCFELGGRHFCLAMDDGREFSFFFADGETVRYAEKGREFVWDTYECLKGDDTTYFVHMRPAAEKGRVNWSLILDTAQRLVTVIRMEEGVDPELERLIRVTPFFGAIRVPGRELPKIRHHFDDRMVGRHVTWHYAPGFSIQHIYHGPHCLRANSGTGFASAADAIQHQLDTELLHAPQEVRDAQLQRLAFIRSIETVYPFYEEPCFHIWINERLNLFCFFEENQLRCVPGHQRGGGILLLQDVDRVADVGLCFEKDKYYMCTAYGVENDRPDPLDTRPSPYDWTQLTSMPCIFRNSGKTE